jgi:hypothetical protein
VSVGSKVGISCRNNENYFFHWILNKTCLCRSILLEGLVISNTTVMSGFLMSQIGRGASWRYAGSNRRDGFLILQCS